MAISYTVGSTPLRAGPNVVTGDEVHAREYAEFIRREAADAPERGIEGLTFEITDYCADCSGSGRRPHKRRRFAWITCPTCKGKAQRTIWTVHETFNDDAAFCGVDCGDDCIHRAGVFHGC